MNWVSIGSDNGLSPGRRQAIILTNADILSIGPQGTYFSEILFEIQVFSFKKTRLNMSSAKWRLFCPGGNELKCVQYYISRSLYQIREELAIVVCHDGYHINSTPLVATDVNYAVALLANIELS